MLDVIDGVARKAVYVLVIPDIGVEFHETLTVGLTVREEVFVLVLLQVTLVNIDG